MKFTGTLYRSSYEGARAPRRGSQKGNAAVTPQRLYVPMRDFIADWRKWSRAERVLAIVDGLLMIALPIGLALAGAGHVKILILPMRSRSAGGQSCRASPLVKAGRVCSAPPECRAFYSGTLPRQARVHGNKRSGGPSCGLIGEIGVVAGSCSTCTTRVRAGFGQAARNRPGGRLPGFERRPIIVERGRIPCGSAS